MARGDAVASVPQHTVHSEEPYEDGIKASVNMRIVTSVGATPEQLRALLLHHYERQRARGGWTRHDRTTQVWLYVHHSEESAQAGEAGWIASLQWNGLSEPRIIINEDRIEALQEPEPSNTRFTERERREIHWALAEAEQRAVDEASGLHPTDLERMASVANRLEEQYKGRVLRRYGITDEQATAIGVEAVREGWPIERQ